MNAETSGEPAETSGGPDERSAACTRPSDTSKTQTKQSGSCEHFASFVDTGKHADAAGPSVDDAAAFAAFAERATSQGASGLGASNIDGGAAGASRPPHAGHFEGDILPSPRMLPFFELGARRIRADARDRSWAQTTRSSQRRMQSTRAPLARHSCLELALTTLHHRIRSTCGWDAGQAHCLHFLVRATITLNLPNNFFFCFYGAVSVFC